VAGLAVREVEEEDAGDADPQARVDPGLADRAAERALELGPRGRHRVAMLVA